MNEKSILALGFDLGGTNLKAGLVNSKGQVLARCEEGVPPEKTPESVLKIIEKMAQELSQKTPPNVSIKGVGVGIPGGINVEKGLVTQSPHYPLWKDIPFCSQIEKSLKYPTKMDNDANCFALGELHFGYGKDLDCFLALTLGTGIGGAIILNRKIWHGPSGMAGEIGHMGIDPKGPDCACGGKGCLETFASGSALIQMAEKEMKVPMDGKKLEEAAQKGDGLAKDIFSRFGYTFGYGLSSIANVIGITEIIIGGKVIRAWDFIYPKMKEAINNQCFRLVSQKVRIRSTSLGDNAGILGAASLVFN